MSRALTAKIELPNEHFTGEELANMLDDLARHVRNNYGSRKILAISERVDLYVKGDEVNAEWAVSDEES